MLWRSCFVVCAILFAVHVNSFPGNNEYNTDSVYKYLEESAQKMEDKFPQFVENGINNENLEASIKKEVKEESEGMETWLIVVLCIVGVIVLIALLVALHCLCGICSCICDCITCKCCRE